MKWKLRTWRDDLVEKTPELFENPKRPDVISVGDGWHGIVGAMLSSMTDVLRVTPGSMIKIDRIETKYGGMRVSVSGLAMDDAVRAEIEDAAELAEARSSYTCEFCGDNGRLRESRLGWQVTTCELHAGDATVIDSNDRSGLFVRRAFDGNRVAIVRCRRYVRSHDRFIDVDPRSVDLEE